MKKLSLFILFFLSSICIFAQTRFYGTVTTSGGESVPYVNVLLINAADSVYIDGTTADIDGHFDFTTVKDCNGCMLKVSQVGYIDKYITNLRGESYSIILEEPVNELNEVVVTTNKPITRVEDGALATDIFNTSLRNRRFITYSGNSDIDVLQHINMRGIECTVRYNFNATKSKYTGRGAGDEEKSRM